MKFKFVTLIWLLALKGFAADNTPATLDQLLQQVIADQKAERKTNAERERHFLSSKQSQQKFLAEAKRKLKEEEARGDKLRNAFDNNEKQLAELETKLKITMGELGELFGVVRQVAGDTVGTLTDSIVSAQYSERLKFVRDLSTRKELPNKADLSQLWVSLLTEMTENGKVVSFQRQVTGSDGVESPRRITRIGAFNLVSGGKYLLYNSDINKVVELGRQPQERYLSSIKELEEAKTGLVAVGIDPSMGTLLSMLVQAPNLMERIHQGGIVGYVILALLVVGMLITGERLIHLLGVSGKVNRQIGSQEISQDNPLGRVLRVYEENKGKDLESLELKLDEAILNNSSNLERGIGAIKILATVAPLLGLLGTVTGMIVTFQSIQLFGTGDPKLMAGGISQALVTTVLGLVAAIPLLLLHAVVNAKSKGILKILDEQSLGMIAARSEQEAST